jgi:Holliday junction resolvasome RuvABC endonuclease subunit
MPKFTLDVRTETLLAIDPATKTLGWAVFRRSAGGGRGWKLIDSGFIKQRGENWIVNLDAMVSRVRAICTEYGVTRGIIEQPEVFGSARGEGAGNTGSILKLTACAWSLRQQMKCMGIACDTVPVRKWKGQVKKHITAMRVQRVWGWQGTDNNESDAVGVGDWYIRKGPGLSN